MRARQNVTKLDVNSCPQASEPVPRMRRARDAKQRQISRHEIVSVSKFEMSKGHCALHKKTTNAVFAASLRQSRSVSTLRHEKRTHPVACARDRSMSPLGRWFRAREYPALRIVLPVTPIRVQNVGKPDAFFTVDRKFCHVRGTRRPSNRDRGVDVDLNYSRLSPRPEAFGGAFSIFSSNLLVLALPKPFGPLQTLQRNPLKLGGATARN
jgi:hypothetical protein